jgi:WD40 repeat protein
MLRSEGMGSLFVSHSSQDDREVARLSDWLSQHGFRSFFLDFDPERGFAAGARWEAELYAQLRRADAVLFVGSPASVTSQWCFAELTMTRSLGKTIIPVIVRLGGAHPLLADTQTVDLTGLDERAYERLLRKLLAAELDPERTFDWDPTRSPFPGLESFQERDAAVFFGRHIEVELLLAQMRSRRRRHTGRLLAVVGPSGSGKSSLVRAGVLPRLRRSQPAWVVLAVLRPGDRPLRQLAHALVDAFPDGDAPSLESVEHMLDQGPAGLVALADQISDQHSVDARPDVLVFVDQAEELVTASAGEEHARFLALLHAATRGPGAVWSLLTLRSEFLSTFLVAARGEVAFDDQVLVGPLDAARLAEIIERPGDRAGVSFAPGLVGRMVADTGGGDALPLLAHTLAALYARARVRPGASITIADYEALGGVVGALRRSAAEEHRRLSERGLGEVVLPTLKRLVTVGPEGQSTRRRLRRAAFSGAEEEIVLAFIEARLLTSAEVDGESVVEVAHEALLRQWPPLADAIERDRELLQLRSEIEREAQDWQRSGRRDEYLLPAARLAAAGQLSSSAASELTQLERAFLAASKERQRSEEAARQRRTRRAIASLAGALVIVSALAFIAVLQRSQATEQTDIAQAERLATNAIAQLTTDPGQSLTLGMQAYAKKRTPLTEGALRVAASRAIPQIVLRGHHSPIRGLALADDGQHLASADEGGTIRIWDLRSPRTPPTLLRVRQPATAVAFAPGGRMLASAHVDGTVRIWNRRFPRTPPTILRSNGYTVTAVAFAGDGRHLATTPEDGTVRIWDRRSPHTPPIPLRSNRYILSAVAFASDGRHLASAGGAGKLHVWDWRSPQTPPIRLRSRSAVWAVAFASDGRHLATAGEDGTVRIWDWRSPRRPPIVLRGRQGTVGAVAFARDGHHVAGGGRDGTVKVWDWRSSRRPRIVLQGHQGSVTGVAFMPDGRHLASAGVDGTVRIWEWRPSSTPPTTLRHQHFPIDRVAFAPDARRFASVDYEGAVRIWDRRTPHSPPIRLRGTRKQEFLNDVAFAPDGSHLAASGNGMTRIWDRRTPRDAPTVVRTRRASTDDIAFAPDGRHLAAASEDGAVRIWDWQSPRTPPIRLRSRREFLTSVAFAPDGWHLAASGDDGVRIWNWRTPHTAPTLLRSQQGIVWRVVFASDGRHLASRDDDGIRVWDWRAPRASPTVLRSGRAFAGDLTFAADGRHIASNEADGSIWIWDWRSPTTLPTVLRGHKGPIAGMAFAPDGRHLISTGTDRTVREWDCLRCGPINDVLKTARARTPRDIEPR